ncbi:MAG: hypothetical protein OEY64_00930 [Nitrospinota bacterium]|nr:hypothetical protein [Nitrospinota bacterium]
MEPREKRARIFLLNALILPGAGHIYAGKKFSGGALAFSFVMAMFFFFRALILVAADFFRSPDDVYNFMGFIFRLSGDGGFMLPLGVSVLIWLSSMIDSARISGGPRGA